MPVKKLNYFGAYIPALLLYCRQIIITDPDVLATSGEAFHPIVTYTGDSADTVEGMVFDVSIDELKRADAYEVADYKRVAVKLDSRVSAWVYVDCGTNSVDGVEKSW